MFVAVLFVVVVVVCIFVFFVLFRLEQGVSLSITCMCISEEHFTKKTNQGEICILVNYLYPLLMFDFVFMTHQRYSVETT